MRLLCMAIMMSQTVKDGHKLNIFFQEYFTALPNFGRRCIVIASIAHLSLCSFLVWTSIQKLHVSYLQGKSTLHDASALYGYFDH